VIIFATSDKGGTGRSVTSANVFYRKALMGADVAYLDFDFGSPTSGEIFSVQSARRGVARGGLHSYFRGDVPQPQQLDLWRESDRASLQKRPTGAGRLVLFPGDMGGGEFAVTEEMVKLCVRLFLRMEEEFDVTLVDLSAGRSYATAMVLDATARPELANVTARWLVFHRWTRQHITAADGLVNGVRGILDTGVSRGHKRPELASVIRYVRTAVIDPADKELAGLRAEQVAWLTKCNGDLLRQAAQVGIGNTTVFGSVPLDALLQWKEQLITDTDVLTRQIANQSTVDAFEDLAYRIDIDSEWETL
jgi:hypothetical protein